MKGLVLLIASLALTVTSFAETSSEEQRVREIVQGFYADFNSHDWSRRANYTTEDWNHINPLGGWARGREAVLKELERVHSTFLKGVSDTIDDQAVRFATPEVAVVTVTSHMSTFITPDGVKHETEKHLRTFVVVKRSDRWLIMQDQNTAIAPGR